VSRSQRPALVRCAALPLAAFALATNAARAQDWQRLDAARPLAPAHRDGQTLHVRVSYGAGTLRLAPARDGQLYDVQLRYDATRVDPRVEWREASRTLRVETRLDGVRFGRLESGDLTLGLAREVPLDLDVQVGAVEAQLDLTGLQVRSLDFTSGASDATVRMDTAAAVPLTRLALQVGAGRLRVEGLGHARVRRVEATGGMGELVLDFAGAWREDVDVDLALAIGSARLVVPADVGVRVEASARWLNQLELPGFVERDGARVSANWDSAARKLTVDLSSVLGRLVVERP
jgi:hypothetical protein